MTDTLWNVVLGAALVWAAIILCMVVMWLGSGHLQAWRRRRKARRQLPAARR